MTALGAGLVLQQSPSLSMSPLAGQVLRLLALPQREVDAVVAEQVASNALLQVGPPRRCRWCAGWIRGGRCAGCAPVHTGEGRGTGSEAAERPDVRDALRRDARLLVRAGLRPAVDAVVAALDERGHLAEPLHRLSAVTGHALRDLLDAVHAVRAAGPPGIAEADSTASLLAQARWHVARGAPQLLVPLVERGLEALAGGDLVELALLLDADLAAVDAAVDFLRRRLVLSPLGSSSVRPVELAPPDAIVTEQDDGALTVQVLGAADLGLALDPDLAAQRLDGEAGRWLAAQVAEARLLLDAVDRRATTLQRVVAAAVAVQRDYVRRGPGAHVPLTRAELAASLGVHASTVSRAVAGTVLAMPSGRREPLSAFFGRSVRARAQLARLLASADAPACDADAAAQLASAGFPVARRTVAKYRQQLRTAT